MNSSFSFGSAPDTKPHDKTAALQAYSAGGGLMGKLIREFDWAATPLGKSDDWPQSLRSSLSICLNSNFPIAIYWGPELILLYNDAWAPIPGNKHSWALGRPAGEVWPEIWSAIEPQFQKAFQGEPGGSKDALLPMQRHGYTEECYFDFTFTPVFGEKGTVEGIFNAVIETTYRIINERRTAFLQKLSHALMEATTLQELFQQAVATIQNNPKDIPFVLVYTLSPEGKLTQQASTLAEQSETVLRKPWPVDELLHSGQSVHLKGLDEWLVDVPAGFWPEPLTEALLTPLKGNDGSVTGCMVLGISARRTFDAEYQSFLDAVTTSVGSVVNTLVSLEQERRRSEALAEIDKAKTVFFSNISHEFRTPLTLMLGSLEELLASPSHALTDTSKATVERAHRNTLRLLRLVNNLLDFSRIEAGRAQANYQLTDIATYTADLASSFRSLVENAGLTFQVYCEPIAEPVYVDRTMWEKIILNLLSNAFKYTFQGNISLRLAPQNQDVMVWVTDTGVGIPQAELPHIFQRFHRVQSTVGRTYEGTGIGLSLVSELVKLHGGTIAVQSTEGVGSEFRVAIPVGYAHLPEEQIRTGWTESVSEPFIEEIISLETPPVAVHSPAAATKMPTVLVVDDNADMRAYLCNLLQTSYRVQTAANGREAWESVCQSRPDVVVSDIMMPVMDGIAFVREMKQNQETAPIPIILLSARAGEEATLEGYDTGADDYLVKPFSAKELHARIRSHLKMAQSRLQFHKTLHDVFTHLPGAIAIFKGPAHSVQIANDRYLQLVDKRREVFVGSPFAEAMPDSDELEILDRVFATGETEYRNEVALPVQGQERYFTFVYQPLPGNEEAIESVLVTGFDITEQVMARKTIEEKEERFRYLANQSPMWVWMSDVSAALTYANPELLRFVGLASQDISGYQWEQVVHPDDIPIAYEKVKEAVEKQETYEMECRLQNAATGVFEWFALKAVPRMENGVLAGFIGTGTNIHTLKTLTASLEEQVAQRTAALREANMTLEEKNTALSNARYFLQTVLDSSMELVTSFDKNLRFTFINKQAETFIGTESTHFIGKSLTEQYPGIEQTIVYQHLHQALAGQTVYVQQRQSLTHQNKVLDTYYIPLKREDEVTGVVALSRDITSYIQLTEELTQANKKLERSNKDLQQFAHVASHDLKEPVRKIKLFAGRLQHEYETTLSGQGKIYLEKIGNAARRMQSMIDGVLSYSTIEAPHEMTIPVVLDEVVTHIRTDLELVMEEQKARLEVGSLPVIQGSPVWMYQLFYNLIHNAFKFAKPDVPPEVYISSQFVQPDTAAGRMPHTYAEICIRDNGIGFDAADAERIFDTFTRLHSKDDYEGTGLGLALCKKIVQRHGGSIRAESNRGEGAVFILTLPLVQPVL